MIFIEFVSKSIDSVISRSSERLEYTVFIQYLFQEKYDKTRKLTTSFVKNFTGTTNYSKIYESWTHSKFLANSICKSYIFMQYKND
jgi:hypothetical protein